ncbi:MAG TPA: IS110 family transposase [Agrobacterium sp.]|uniref:IS110 family transposase n=1 Tax=Agrobacterium pusense TaxID=648995 RepID=UPI000E947439|nr:IS110 family transposase [Agrobacterium sp.]
MTLITTVGLDTAKQVFQLHGVDNEGNAILRRQLRRSEVLRFFSKVPSCVVGLEACGGAHYWAREIKALGHEVRLIPPAYVKPYVKRGKNDAADAEAICEAVGRPSMRFVPLKTVGQQASAMLLKARDLLVRQRTQTINALRGHLTGLGITISRGVGKVDVLAAIVRDEDDARLPPLARIALLPLTHQIEAYTSEIVKLEKHMVRETRQDSTLSRLTSIPGVGPITASSIAAFVPDPQAFKSGRHFAAWIGLTPKSNSTGGKTRLGRISKMGNPVLRSLLVVGASAVIQHARRGAKVSAWLSELLRRRPYKVAAIALANKMARIVWALLVRGGQFHSTANETMAA